MRSLASIPALLLFSILPATGRAEDRCLQNCRWDVSCQIQVGDCLLHDGRIREAIEHAKSLWGRFPQIPAYARSLAKAYLADHNSAWAQRVLQEAIARDPDDCESRSWLAWVFVTQGFLDLAEEALRHPGCPSSEPERARWELLQAELARLKDDPTEAVAALQAFGESGRVFSEDREAWTSLRSTTDAAWIQPIQLRLDLATGYTTNAAAGLLVDLGRQGPGSVLGQVDLFGRFVWPASHLVHPGVEASLTALGFAAGEASSMSDLDIVVRPEVMLGGDNVRVLLAYRLDQLLVDEKTYSQFFIAHRGEVEVETGGLTVFAGAGRRFFHRFLLPDGTADFDRTRTEIDGGLGGSLQLWQRLQLTLVASLRYYRANSDPYNQLGATAFLLARLDLGYGLVAQLGLTGGLDSFPDSGGLAGGLAFGISDRRFDLFARIAPVLWSPPWTGFRIGLGYDFAWRDSTADADPKRNYDYQDHRVILRVRWAYDLDPGAPGVAATGEHVTLDYGTGGNSMEEERVQDLVRQDQASRRDACGCGH